MLNLKEIANKKHFRIGIDQDYPLADLNKKWLETYNTIFNDNLKPENLTTWNMVEHVKEEAKPYMLNILNLHKFYRDLAVVKDSQRVVKTLQDMGHEIFIVTDPFTRMSFKSKYDWLKENFPFIDPRNFIFTGNKSSIGLDFLIDDGIHNCKDFQGIPLLFEGPHNKNCNSYFKVKNWQDVEHIFTYRIKDIFNFYNKRNE